VTERIKPPAGWFPDPKSSNQNRWFDGEDWTDHIQPTPDQGTSVSQPAAAPRPDEEVAPLPDSESEAKDANRPATASITVAIVAGMLGGIVLSVSGYGLFVWLVGGIAAAIVAIFGLAKASHYRREGLEPAGFNRSRAALIVGLVEIALFLGLIAVFASIS
jgi:hypothetical protein